MKKAISIVALAALAGLANAGTIKVEESAVGGGTFTLNSGNLSPTVFGAASSPNFTNGALGFIHSELATDGVNTNDIVTIIAGDTNDGLGLFALIDQQAGAFVGFNSRLDMNAIAVDTAGNGIKGWVNDNAGELIQTSGSNPIAGTFSFNTTFQWDNAATGDAMALSNLNNGDNGTFVFNTLPGFGTTGVARGFQYVSFINGNWTVVGAGSFNSSGASTSLDWQVIPLPGVGAMSLAGLALVGARRRRAM